MKNRVSIDFTKSGWRQFARMNRFLGVRYVKGFILRHEVAAYIAAHEESGRKLDTTCQEIRYEGGVYLLLMKCQGTWYITGIWVTDAPEGFAPVFVWKRIILACRDLLARVLVGWRSLWACPRECVLVTDGKTQTPRWRQIAEGGMDI